MSREKIRADTLRYASFKYSLSQNLGDQIQTLAAEQYLPSIDRRINRDEMRHLKLDAPHLVIMNGWFSHFPELCFPPTETILPVFWGFHINPNQANNLAHFTSAEVLDYLKCHQAIGCRDRSTQAILQAHGIETFYSQCLTLTFPRRLQKPKEPIILVVDADFAPLKSFNHPSMRVTHTVGDYYPDDLKISMARHLLNLYRQQAGLIVTTRLHCALPCIAMGIPVVFFGKPDDPRFSILHDIGQPIYPPDFARTDIKQINWNPKPIDIEAHKQQMRQDIKQLIQNKLNDFLD